MSISSGTLNIIRSRVDLSPFLFHFTKDANAFETLKQILEDSALKSLSKDYLCFTEAPLTAMGALFDHFGKFHDPMYAPYGVAFNRNKFFELGGRPVIYGSDEEFLLLPEELRWRFELYNPTNSKGKDFTWLREWRIKAQNLTINPDDVFIITKTSAEMLEITTGVGVDVDGDYSDKQWHPQYNLYNEREWKAISIEELKELSVMSDHELENLIGRQNLGDDAQQPY